MGRRDKNGLPADPVHVDAGAGLQVVQVDIAVFGNEEDYILFGTDLNKPAGDNWLDQLQALTSCMLEEPSIAVSPAWPQGSHSVLLGGKKHPQLSLERAGSPWVGSPLR